MCKLQSLLSSSNSRVLQSVHVNEEDDDIEFTKTSIGGAEPTSACLWAMVNDFLVVGTPIEACPAEEDPFASTRFGALLNNCDAILKKAIQDMETIFGESSLQDSVEAKIASCVTKALTSKSGAESSRNEQARAQACLCVLKHLQREGYNAGLCVTTRKPGNAPTGLPPTGGHQYIDVITEEKLSLGTPLGKISSEKVIVDVGFSVHFKIARPLPAYQSLIAMLPSTFVGTTALLQRVVCIMSQAARASLESQDMSIPPWRSFSFLLAKWLSPSCSRITCIDKAKPIVLNASSTNCVKPCVVAERDYNTDLAVLTESPVEDNFKKASKLLFLQDDHVAKAWCPPPPTNQLPVDESSDVSSRYIKKRRQASVVSALALAIAETQHPHTSVAAPERKVPIRPQPSTAAVSVL